MQEIPARPDVQAPPPKPKKARLVVMGAAGMFLALLILGNLFDIGESSNTTPITTDVGSDISDTLTEEEIDLEAARLAWYSALTPSERANICDYYNTPPVGTTPEMVETYAEGADMTYAEADRILGQILAAEC